MASFPTKPEIIAFLSRQDGKTGKRDIARAFQIKGKDRVRLKQILRELKAEGLIMGGRKTGIHTDDVLPNVCVIRLTHYGEEQEFHAARVVAGEVVKPTDHADAAPEIIIDERIIRGKPMPIKNLQIGDTLLARLRKSDAGTYLARPIRRLNQPSEKMVGIIRHYDDGLYLEGVHRRHRHDYRVKENSLALEAGDLVMAEKTERMAQVIRKIGKAADPHCFSLIALAEQDVLYEFPDEVMAAAQAQSLADNDKREDLQHIPFITIDPISARDHDDAIYAQADESGFLIYVAIADVAAYVKPNSALDKEARKRGNSIYLPDRVVPMLPEHLSNDLCSLREGEIRPAMVMQFRIDEDAKRSHVKLMRASIRVAHKLHYQQAQDMLTQADVPDALQHVWDAYQIMARARDKRQPLALNLPERQVEMDAAGRITHIHTPPVLEMHRLIEEYMVTANRCAAEILERKNNPCLYRVHGTPAQEKITALADFVKSFDVKINRAMPKTPLLFNQILDKTKHSPQQFFIMEAILRSQMQAEYSLDNIGHFGLNLSHYTHFTSPIRRYADLLIHRALITAFDLGEDGLSAFDIENMADTARHISQTERQAMLAERQATERYLSAFMVERIGQEFVSRVSGLSRAGLFVRLDEYGAEGLIPISHLGADYYRLSDNGFEMVGERTGETFHLGQALTVKLEEAVPLKGGLRFSLAARPSKSRPSQSDRKGRARPQKRRLQKGQAQKKEGHYRQFARKKRK